MATNITVSAKINATITKVWDCYNLPKHIKQWNFADPSWQCPSAENNLEVGGKYSSRMEAKDGSFGFDFWYIYDTVVQHKELSYTMGDGRKAKTLFEVNGNKTILTTTFEAETENTVELQQGGWQSILNNFKKYTEGLM